MSFRNKNYSNETSLSKYIWQLKDSKQQYRIQWKIIKRTSGFNKINHNCSLCLSEKYAICRFKMKTKLLNKRSELINKCRHENKYLLKYHQQWTKSTGVTTTLRPLTTDEPSNATQTIFNINISITYIKQKNYEIK